MERRYRKRRLEQRFSAEENAKLQEIIGGDEYLKEIIANREHTKTVIAAKEEAWKSIEEEFNSSAIVYRSIKSLRKRWENIQTGAKAKEQAQRHASGGRFCAVVARRTDAGIASRLSKLSDANHDNCLEGGDRLNASPDASQPMESGVNPVDREETPKLMKKPKAESNNRLRDALGEKIQLEMQVLKVKLANEKLINENEKLKSEKLKIEIALKKKKLEALENQGN